MHYETRETSCLQPVIFGNQPFVEEDEPPLVKSACHNLGGSEWKSNTCLNWKC